MKLLRSLGGIAVVGFVLLGATTMASAKTPPPDILHSLTLTANADHLTSETVSEDDFAGPILNKGDHSLGKFSIGCLYFPAVDDCPFLITLTGEGTINGAITPTNSALPLGSFPTGTGTFYSGTADFIEATGTVTLTSTSADGQTVALKFKGDATVVPGTGPDNLRLAATQPNISVLATSDGSPGVLGGTPDTPWAPVHYRVPTGTDGGRPITSTCLSGSLNGPMTDPVSVTVGSHKVICTIIDSHDHPTSLSTTFTLTVHNSLAVFDGAFLDGKSLYEVAGAINAEFAPYIRETRFAIGVGSEKLACSEMKAFEADVNTLYAGSSATYDGNNIDYLLSVGVSAVFACFNSTT
jgi:hypothetical protein